jgi:hypothetical protein
MTSRLPQRRERRLRSQKHPLVQLHIERLVLHGVRPVEIGRFTRALEAELARLAGQPGQVFAAVDAERVAPVHFASRRGAEPTGRAVASALWAGALRVGRE